MPPKHARALWADLEGVPASTRDRVVLFRLLITLGARLRGLMDQRYRTSGITTQQAAVLAITAAAEAPLTQGAVARRLGVSHQNVRQLADALVAKRLLEIRAHPSDKRIKHLVPSARAAPLFARRNKDDFDAIAGWFSVLTDEDARALLAALGRLLEAVAGEGDPDDWQGGVEPDAGRRRASARVG